MKLLLTDFWHGSCAVAVSLALSTTSALGEEYPYSGVFWMSGSDVVKEELDARCALSFLEQRKDGNWFFYHIDLDEFRKSRTVQYLQFQSGHCKYESETRVESCVTFFSKSWADGEGETAYSVIVDIEESKVETVNFQNQIDLESGLRSAEGLKSGTALNFLRCQLPEETLLLHRVDRITDLSEEALIDFTSPSKKFISNPIVDLLVTTLRQDVSP